jgi:hypothetical protein
LIEARAAEIVAEFEAIDELDDLGRVALGELARLQALIEAIDQDLSERGLTDRNGKERYLLQRRERYSRRLIDVTAHLVQSRARSKRAVSNADEVVGERIDYVRTLQAIAFGCEPEARISERLGALKLLLPLETRGTTSYFTSPPASPSLEEAADDDPAHAAEVARLKARLAEAKKTGELVRLKNEILCAEMGG